MDFELLSAPLKFDWDKGNIDKNKKHGVSNEEAEEVFTNQPLILLEDEKHSSQEKRMMVLGVSDGGRRLSVVFTIRQQLIRIISARPMSRKERRFYEQEIKTNS